MTTTTTPSTPSATADQSDNSPATPSDPRPRFGVGHISLAVSDVDRSASFYENVGMRLIVNMGRAAILELRGGTHLIVHQGAVDHDALDLIVDDIDDTHRVLADQGANPTRIERGNPHDRFTATDPDGNLLVVNSNHAMGPV